MSAAPTLVRDGEEPPFRARFTLYDDEEIEQLPPPTWEIESILPANGFAVLFGEKGHGKSFVALDIASHIALGLDWHGYKVKSGNVLYVYAEGRNGLSSRLKAWKKLNGWHGRIGVLFIPQRITVNESRDVRSVLAALADRFGCTPLGTITLIIIDTLNRNSTGNENSTEDMSAIVRGCDVLREATGAAVLVVHHKGYAADDRGRGSSVLDAAADTVIAVSKDEERITLECKKQKDAAEFAPMHFEAVPIAGSLALKPSGVASGALKGQRLQALLALHENSTDEGLRYKAWFEVSGIRSASSFNKARDWLKANSYVTVNSGRWTVTDVARVSLNSTHSTGTPPLQSGARSTLLHQQGGVCNTPLVELDPRPADRGEAWEPESAEP